MGKIHEGTFTTKGDTQMVNKHINRAMQIKTTVRYLKLMFKLVTTPYMREDA